MEEVCFVTKSKFLISHCQEAEKLTNTSVKGGPLVQNTPQTTGK